MALDLHGLKMLMPRTGQTPTATSEAITEAKTTSQLQTAILRLKEQERTVLSLYYFEELKLHEIAGILRLTESRVSQIRSKALQKLRADLRPLREEVA